MDAVSSIMSRPVVAIRSDCDLVVAVDTLVCRSVRHLVVGGARPAGAGPGRGAGRRG